METFPKQALPAGVQPINLLWHKPFRIRFSVTCNQYSLEGPLARSQVTASPCDISCDLASEPPLTTPLKLPSTSPPRSLPVPVQPRTPQPLIPCSGPCLLDIRPPRCCTPSARSRPGTREALGTRLSQGPGLSVPTCETGGGALPFAGLPHSGNTLRGFRPQARASPAAYPARAGRESVPPSSPALSCFLCPGHLVTQEVPARLHSPSGRDSGPSSGLGFNGHSGPLRAERDPWGVTRDPGRKETLRVALTSRSPRSQEPLCSSGDQSLQLLNVPFLSTPTTKLVWRPGCKR